MSKHVPAEGSRRLSIYLSPDEVALLEPVAKRAGLSVYQYVKDVALKGAQDGVIPKRTVRIEFEAPRPAKRK